MIKKDIYKFWESIPAVRDQVGGRVFLGAARQDQPLPYVVLHTLSTRPHYHLQNEDQIRTETVEMEVFAETVGQLHKIAEAIRLATSGYTGQAGDAYVYGCHLDRDQERREVNPDGSGIAFSRTLDYRITYTQPVPNHGAT